MKENAEEEELIIMKIKSFEQQAAAKYNGSSIQATAAWFTKLGLQTTIQRLPRINQSQAILTILRNHPEDYKKLFGDSKIVCGLLDSIKQIYDIAFIHQHYQKNAGANYDNEVINRIERQFSSVIDRAQDIDSIFFTQQLNLFVSMKQALSKQNSSLISDTLFQRQRRQIATCYEFLIKPLFEKKNLKPYYSKLTGLTSWLVLIGEERQDLAYDLAKKINSFVIYTKNTNSIQMINTCNIIFDLLSVKFPREAKIKHQNLGALLFRLTKIKMTDFFQFWIEARRKYLDMLDFENFFRVLTNLGCSQLVIPFLLILWNFAINNKRYGLLLHLFSGYIRREFTKLKFESTDELSNYCKIIKLFMLGLSNRERFEGEQIDELTANICEHALRPGFAISQCYKKIIEIYATYENRFGCLSETSKRFLSQLESLFNYKLPIAEIMNIYQQYAIHDIGIEDVDQQWQSMRKTSNRYRGMQNLGNTCYINAFMQALYMTKKFRMVIHNLTQDGSLSSSKVKAYALQFLFQELTRKEFEIMQPVRPDYFRTQLSQPFRSSFNQQDSAQFGRIYLQELMNQLENEEDGSERLGRLLAQKFTKLLRCLKCGSVKQQEEKVFDIILTLQKGEMQICLSRLIQNYFRPQHFSKENSLECSKCAKRTQAICQLIPHRFSDILVLTLSIFEYVGEGKKILLPLNFQFVLNIGALLNLPELGEYELYAFIVHMGSQQGSGHYVCYARNLEENPMIWYNFNDGYVEELEITKTEDFGFGENQTPYMLFYSKKASVAASRLQKP